MYLYISPE
jgi:hypothetical protein